ncbi:hypothetical protein V6N13_072459 [Hibiscus sabdariffa]
MDWFSRFQDWLLRSVEPVDVMGVVIISGLKIVVLGNLIVLIGFDLFGNVLLARLFLNCKLLEGPLFDFDEVDFLDAKKEHKAPLDKEESYWDQQSKVN